MEITALTGSDFDGIQHYEGTTGIQALDLALRKVAKDGGVAAGEFILEMRSNWPAAAQAAGLHEALPDIGASLSTLKAATDWLVSKASVDPTAVQGIAVHYLMMWGIVLGSWLTTTGAQEERSRAGRARFFLKHRLPRVHMHWRIIEGGWDAISSEDIA